MKDVMDIKALDDHRIEVTLASANADFPTALTDYHLMMVPDGFTDWSKPVGRALSRSRVSTPACGLSSRGPAPTGNRTAATSTV